MNLEKKSIALGVEAAGKRKAIEIVGKLLVQNRHIDPGYVEGRWAVNLLPTPFWEMAFPSSTEQQEQMLAAKV